MTIPNITSKESGNTNILTVILVPNHIPSIVCFITVWPPKNLSTIHIMVF